MKKTFKILISFTALLIVSASVCSAKTELYALDGRTMFVEENQIEVYTAEGMGWYLKKPVTMYAADGRTLVVPADKVEAHKAVGWFVKDDNKTEDTNNATENQEENVVPENPTNEEKTFVRYTDGTIVKVPKYHIVMYKALGWEEINAQFAPSGNVIMYNADGETIEVALETISQYELAGWSLVKPGTENDTTLVKMYDHSGNTKEVPSNEVESYKSKAWGLTHDEAVYTYATRGDGGDKVGAVSLLENNRYELAFLSVQEALSKLEGSSSEYLSLLYYLRTNIIDTWGKAAKSPLGFINYWFSDKDSGRVIVFEYRNLGNQRITYFGINFDICDKDGNVIETNSGSYYVNNLQLVPCDKTRVGWSIKSGDSAVSIKNVKVKEVRFADGTSWTAAE